MRLSEAIRLGSMIRPQGFERLYVDGGSCAAGAALEAVGRWKDGMFALGLWGAIGQEINAFPGLPPLHRQECPTCQGGVMMGDWYSALIHLNDHHRWTREQIADWVEKVERLAPDEGALPLRGDTCITGSKIANSSAFDRALEPTASLVGATGVARGTP